MQSKLRMLLVSAAASLAACGGGGSSGPSFTPAPPSTPTPSPTPTPEPTPGDTAVTIFPSPTPQEYASVGVSVTGPGGNLDTYESPDTRFDSVSSAEADQAKIRYSSAGYYEIQMPGGAWDRLVHYGFLDTPNPEDNNYFEPESVETNFGYLVIGNAAKSGDYDYSEIGAWGSAAAGRYGAMAFGEATPSGSVPTTGSATFQGIVWGNADIMQAHLLYGGYVPLYLEGDVTLAFNFGSGSLTGEMSLLAHDGGTAFHLGSFGFTDTVFSAGSSTYSGSFDSTAAGENFFFGRFTGPNAEETIGAWALPFVFTNGGQYVPADGQVHQAYGAWIAKR